VTELPNAPAVETVCFAFNGRRFARESERYCREHGLRCSWVNNHAILGRSLTTFEVTGTREQLRDFVSWGDKHFRRPGFAKNFDGEPFMPAQGIE
jgi:hypothetical protein